MSNAGLRCPISGGDCCKDRFAINNYRCGNYLFTEYAIVQSEGSRIQVEISSIGREEGCRTGRPSDIVEIGTRFTITNIAKIAVVWRIFPYVTRIRFWRAANISRRATPECVWSCILRCNFYTWCIGWRRACDYTLSDSDRHWRLRDSGWWFRYGGWRQCDIRY